MAETERVVMLWPKELKEKVRETAGKRGITEFTVKAVGVHLGIDQGLTDVEKELNEVKHFAQSLADQLVLGVESPEERLQALMEVEFPSWIDTSGWPKNFADRVRPDPFEADLDGPSGLSVDDDDQADEAEESVVFAHGAEPLSDYEPEPEVVETVKAPEPTEVAPPPAEDLPVKPRESKDDLFARVMAKTGGALSDVPGLKLASEISRPEVKKLEPEEAGFKVEEDLSGLCPNCKEELVDGECWTCG